MKNFKKLLAYLLSLILIVSMFSTGATVAFAAESDEINNLSESFVAKVGSTEYATIDEAVAAWTDKTTLTLLDNVTLSDVITLKSTEYHVLDLGTYTMTAASKKDAIQIENKNRTSASYALDIKADATNPGGITATGKAIVRHSGSAKDRPITRFYGGVFNATYIVHHSGNNGANSPSFYFYGGEFNGIIYTNRSTNIFYGGTFTGNLQMSVDSSAYTLIAGGTFAKLSNMMGSALNSGKFTIGSSKGVYDKEVYIDDNGNYVIAAAEPAQGIEATVAKTPGTNDYLAYSKVATERVLKYTDAKMALEKNNSTSAKVTIYADEIDLADINYKGTIVVPEGHTLTITNAPEGLNVEGEVTIVRPVAKIGETVYMTLAEAIAAATENDTIVVLADVTEEITSFKGNITTDVEGGVTITNTYSGYLYANNTDMLISEGVTLKTPALFLSKYEFVIKGNIITDALYIADDAVVKIYAPGSVLVNGSTHIRRNDILTAGVYIYGDSDASTVEYKSTYYTGHYSGTFYAENANVEVGYFLLNNSNDTSYGPVKMEMKDSTLTAIGTDDGQNSFHIDGDATIVMNGSAIVDVRDFNIKENTNLTFVADANSSISATYMNIAEDVAIEAIDNGDGTWTLKEVVKGLNGSGTEEDPYLISNVDELIWFRDKVDEQASDGSTQFAGKYFKLTADIDLAGINWNPIGSMSGDHGSFKGVFDGDGHTISNLYVEQEGNGLGLFARTAGNAEIKNLNLVNVTIKSTNNSNYLGCLVGNAYASTKITNVHVSGDILVSGRGYIGGIAGHGYVVMDNVSVKGNEGSLITSTFWCAGGILGYGGEGTTDIKNAHVEGITVTSAAGGLGAIVGMAEDNNGTQPISGSNLSAKNVEIKTYVGGYGTAYEDYAMGYLYGGNPTSKLTGTLEVENVVVETASGNPASINDAVATANGTVYFDLQSAINAGGNVVILRDLTLATGITVPAGLTVTLDLNGYTITGTDTTEKNFGLINNNGNLTITDSVGGGKMTVTATVNSGWNRYSAVISNNPGGVLTVNGGTLEHLGGTDMAYGIDNLTNGKGTYAETIINGGTIKSTYRAVRQFLNGVEAQNILTINGGTIEGANKSVWMQDPNKNANTGSLTVAEGATLNGDVYLFVTAGSTEYPVEVSIAASAVNGEVLTGNFPANVHLQNNNGTYSTFTAEFGDVNFDGSIDAMDVVIIRKAIIGAIEYEAQYDVNQDGKFNVLDLVRIKKILAPPMNIATDTDGVNNYLANGEEVIILDDFATDSAIVMTNGGVINGNNKAIDATGYYSGNDCAIITTGGTIENLALNLKSNSRGIGSGSTGTYTQTENLYINNVTVDGGLYAINTSGDGDCGLYVTDSKLYGWTSYSNLSIASFNNVTFGLGNAYNPWPNDAIPYGGYMSIYSTTTFTDCNFDENFHIGIGEAGLSGVTLTFTNCYYNGTLITANNFADLLVYPVDFDGDSARYDDITVLVNGSVVFEKYN